MDRPDSAPSLPDYSSWSREHLISHIRFLEAKLSLSSNHSLASPGPTPTLIKTSLQTKTETKTATPKSKSLDFCKHAFRKVALTICYDGSRHGGLAWQPDITPLTTVEAELFRALLVSRLVEPGVPDADPDDENWREAVDMAKWGYSRAGRTDAGVSGSGQVVSLWVRSAVQEAGPGLGFRAPISQPNLPPCPARPTAELPYHTILNSLLPPSVRVLAWSPVAAEFDARFSCSARHYKYFFSLYESPQDTPLDIEAMRDAAHRLVGEHDFRNMCKLDPSKQMDNFHRRILSAEISEVKGSHLVPAPDVEADRWPACSNRTNPVFVLDLVGTAFLYNMVRHIVAVLFLVGAGHESPSVIDALLYTALSAARPPSLAHLTGPVATKPLYAHASALPLLLFRCIYPANSFTWHALPAGASKPSRADLFVTWAHDRLRALLSHHHLAAHHQLALLAAPAMPVRWPAAIEPLGAAEARTTNRYVPLLNRPRAAPYAESNAQWWARIGARRMARRQLG